MKKFVTILLLALMAIAPKAAQAAKFANQFVEFELPPQWQCNLEGAEWVCQSTIEEKKREAIIILAAKLRGEQDSLDQYTAYLKRPKTYTSVQSKTVTSEVKYVKAVDINAQPWVDSLQLQSELPGFYTRYLATIKMDIGVLVTYSIRQDKYPEYLEIFENLARTLKVFRKAGGINAGPQGSLFDIKIPQNMSEATVFNTETGATPTSKKTDGDLTLILILGAAAVGFIIWKKRRS